jgi:hypothetical protein
MEITMRWHRLMRALVGIVCFALGLGMAVFIFSNLAPTEIHWRIPANVGYSYDLTFRGVSLWVLAIVPLLVGGVVGYLYQTPARMHHVREALHHRHRVRELEQELKDVRKSLDKLLMMPEDGRPATPALMPPIEHRTAVSVSEPERDPRLPDDEPVIEVLTAKPVRAEMEAAVPEVAKAAKPRRSFFGGLKAEVAEIRLPAAIPATIVAQPRRNGKPANGKPASVKPANVKPANGKPTNGKPTNLKPTNLKPTNLKPTNLKPRAAAKPAPKPAPRSVRRAVKKPD